MSADPRSVDPFALTADPSAYVPSPERERALEQMIGALAAGAVPCLEGPAGIGKTLLLQLLVQRVADRFLPLYLPYPALNAPEICGLALGLLERKPGDDPESALLELAADLALQGRPLLILIDDAASLPEETARGLAQLVARSKGALRIALAGIDSSELLRATAPFGDSLLRVALHEGIAAERLRDYVSAHLELVHAPRSLRDAFDDETLAELGRMSAGNPRRLHIAAQMVARRALKHRGDPTLAAVEASLPAPEVNGAAEAPAPPPPVAPRMLVVEPPPAPPDPAPVSREPEPEPEPEPQAEPVAAAAPPPPRASEPRASEDRGPAGEYRYVRGRPIARLEKLARDAERESLSASPSAPWPEAEVDLTMAALAAQPERVRGPVRARATLPPRPRGAQRTRAPSVIAVALVAAASAVLGFGLASSFLRDGGLEGLLDPRVETEPEVVPETVREVSPAPAPASPPAFPAALPEERIDVSINASPWASVEIDGEGVGETPLGGVPLSPGPHRFRLTYPDGSVKERVIEVDAEHRAIVFD